MNSEEYHVSRKTKSNDGVENILDSIELLDPSTIGGARPLAPDFDSLSKNEELEAKLDVAIPDSPKKVQGQEFSKKLQQVSPQDRSETYKTQKLSEWHTFSSRSERIFGSLIDNGGFVSSVHSLVKGLMSEFSKDRNILLTLSQMPSSMIYSPSEHALKTSIVSICIGASMGYSEDQTLDLGMCAYVSDFGMAFMKDIYTHPEQLSQESLIKLRSHPMIGANIIDGVRGMPSMASLVVYQVHERDNGTGYPKRRNGRFIHDYAKIIAVADIFQALCSPRAHRSAFTPFEAMTKVVGMVRLGSLSVHAVKPFMNYTSLYPIGSLVKLSDSRIGRVVMANGDDIKKPVISVLRSEQGIQLDSDSIYQVDLKNIGDVNIVQALQDSDFDLQKLDGL
jgi:HD-GYP domain-containing protein (c-di-GMP phosphodiesterase class II)